MNFKNVECQLLKIDKECNEKKSVEQRKKRIFLKGVITTLEKQESRIQSKKDTFFWRKQQGQLEWATGMFFILFLSIFLCAWFQIAGYRSASMYLEDALAASNLASALIDVKEYGISHKICISDPVSAYNRYCEAIKINLNLNENWEGSNKMLISGKVSVVNYTIFNVEGSNVTINRVFENGTFQKQYGVLGQVYAPNGTCIETTSVYSEIAFPIEGFLGTNVQAHKGKLADIVVN